MFSPAMISCLPSQDIIQHMSQRAYHLAACCLETVAQSIQELGIYVDLAAHFAHTHTYTLAQSFLLLLAHEKL